MSEFTVTYDGCIEAARLASSRGDRLGAEQALIAAIATAGNPGSEPLLALALMKLGELKRDAGSLAEAEEMFGRAVEICEHTDGDEGVSLATALTNLAGIRAARGAPEDAERHLNRALALGEQRLGREHPDLVVLLNDLSRLYLKRSAFALAEPLLHRLHAIKRQKGEDHAEVATVLASLATVRQALGDHDAAEQLWRRVLAIRERTLAPNHFAIATAAESLGETCSARGKVPEALRLFRRALAMREMTLGPTHPSLRALRERIADLQLQGADEFGAEEAVTFAGAPVAAWIPPSPSYPPADVPAPASARHAAPPVAPADGSEAVPSAGPTGGLALSSLTPVLYAQPKPAESDAPSWDQVAPGPAGGGMTRSTQPMSIILPAPSDVHFGDDRHDEFDADEDRAFAQTRMQRMTGSLGGIFRQRQTQVIAVSAIVVALAVAAAARASQPHGAFDDSALGERIPAQQYIAGGTAALSDSVGSLLADTTESNASASTAPGDTAAASAAPASDSPQTEASGTRRTPSTVAAPAPAPPREIVGLPMPEAPRALPGISTSQLDSAIPVAAPGHVSISPSVATPGFETSLGAVDYTDRAANKPPLVIGVIPRIPYPRSLRVTGRETGGEVVVEFVVDTLGVPVMSTLRIVRSDHEQLSAAVNKVIPAMRFVPATSSGRKMAAKVQIPFAFAVGKD